MWPLFNTKFFFQHKIFFNTKILNTKFLNTKIVVLEKKFYKKFYVENFFGVGHIIIISDLEGKMQGPTQYGG